MKRINDLIDEAYKSAGNPLDPNNTEIAKGFWSAGQPDKKALKVKK